MQKYHERKGFFHINCYQRPILMASTVPLFVLCVIASIYLVYLRKELVNLVLFTTDPPSLRAIDTWCLGFVAGFWCFFLIATSMMYFISSQSVGAFERLVRELDEILDGQKRPLHARKNDSLARDLIQRLNRLIDRLPEEHHGDPG